MRLYGTAIACEVLARRILHKAPTDRHINIMSTRYRHLDRDGEYSDMTSALELAIDTNRFVLVFAGGNYHLTSPQRYILVVK